MATKLYPYKATCETAGVAIYLHARNDDDAMAKLLAHPGYWQAQKRFKTTKKDWVVLKEREG